jgi:hypothetical protein
MQATSQGKGHEPRPCAAKSGEVKIFAKVRRGRYHARSSCRGGAVARRSSQIEQRRVWEGHVSRPYVRFRVGDYAATAATC